MTSVLLVRPPIVYATGTFSAPATPPLSVAYLAATLRAHGHCPLVLDCLGEGLDNHVVSYSPRLRARGLALGEIAQRALDLTGGSVDLIGVSAMFTSEWPHTRAVINELAAAFPGVPIVIGGEHASAAAEQVLADCSAVTFVARGEGEETMLDLAAWVEGNVTREEIGGVSFRQGTEIISNAARPRMTKLEEIPRPAWDLVPIERYLDGDEGHGVHRGRTMPILATRGCPYRCTFCSSPQMWTTRYVTRNPVDVVDEIEHYVAFYGATNIDFYDLTAVTTRKWILRFCDELRRRDLNIFWQLPSGTRSEAMDEEVLAAMFATGCANVTYAPESGSTRTLETIKKKVKLDSLTSSVTSAVACGLSVKCNLILGFPSETRRDVLATLRYAVRLAYIGVEDAGLFIFSPYPGSELYSELCAEGRIPAMDDAYCESLLAYMDIKASGSYCRAIGARELGMWRLLGLLVFYAVSYGRRPSRILRTFHNIRGGRAHSVLETRLHDLRQRKAAPATVKHGLAATREVTTLPGIRKQL